LGRGKKAPMDRKRKGKGGGIPVKKKKIWHGGGDGEKGGGTHKIVKPNSNRKKKVAQKL